MYSETIEPKIHSMEEFQLRNNEDLQGDVIYEHKSTLKSPRELMMQIKRRMVMQFLFYIEDNIVGNEKVTKTTKSVDECIKDEKNEKNTEKLKSIKHPKSRNENDHDVSINCVNEQTKGIIEHSDKVKLRQVTFVGLMCTQVSIVSMMILDVQRQHLQLWICQTL